MRKLKHKRGKKKNTILVISAMCLLLCICVGYAAFQTNISITAIGNVVKNARVIQSWDATSQTDFHSDFYKENIISVTFLDNNNIPTEATDSWNVSEDQENGVVMAWVVPNINDNTKYDLYIGAPYGVIANEDSSYIFYNFTAVESIAFNNNYDTSNATNMEYMFRTCISLETIDVSSFDVSNVTNMQDMFGTATDYFPQSQLKQIIGLENWDTSNVNNMQGMFTRASSLTELDINNWDTSNVTTMAYMFEQTTSLTNLNLNGWDTSKLENMRGMFMNSTSLQNLNLCSFDTSNVTNMESVFYGTTNLIAIYVGSSWTMDKVTNSTTMFLGSGVTGVTTGQC